MGRQVIKCLDPSFGCCYFSFRMYLNGCCSCTVLWKQRLVHPDVALQKQSCVSHPLRNRQNQEHGGATVRQPHIHQSGILSCFNYMFSVNYLKTFYSSPRNGF